MDRAHVPDVLTAASECAAHGRLWGAGGHPQTLQETQAAEAERYGEDCESLGTISQRGLLVYVAESGYQDTLTTEDAGEHREKTLSFPVLSIDHPFDTVAQVRYVKIDQ